MTRGIHHVSVRVTELERSVAICEHHFGFRVASRMTLAGDAAIAFLAYSAGGAQVEHSLV